MTDEERKVLERVQFERLAVTLDLNLERTRTDLYREPITQVAWVCWRDWRSKTRRTHE
jgi:hypothetical protein